MPAKRKKKTPKRKTDRLDFELSKVIQNSKPGSKRQAAQNAAKVLRKKRGEQRHDYKGEKPLYSKKKKKKPRKR